MLRYISNNRTVFLTFFSFRHPDKNNNPEAETKFIEITTAYEVNNLSHRFHLKIIILYMRIICFLLDIDKQIQARKLCCTLE